MEGGENMNKKGFTLIELLVVIAIIGLLSTLAVVALGQARVKARDSKRLSDLKQLQTALELYYTDNNAYPAGSGVVMGATGYKCLTSSGFADTCASGTTYMGQVPTDPSTGQSYTYTAGTGNTSYSIAAALEGTVNGLTTGITVSPSGIAD